MLDEDKEALEHPEVQIGRKASSKIIGYVISLLLTALAFSLVYAHALPGPALQGVIAFLAGAVICVQLYFFSNVDLRHSQRWNLITTILTIPLFALMIGLSIWLFYELALRVQISAGLF
ncbi:cytochrome C oxidase subunit IV family protein [Salinisphaera sp.]|uniref:cytochrome o ubiquinol oxidase subunit IV n=1 Tax=Salinisphaera sp. TaxID=1914330 RepID=UPI002D79B711|nr:cytochrome C oxidase subunit IV family protein [Salinisphaera sp.]HET7313033.1 cytochrome C oxidase subunit IV family protein [Salinisphaera sp.]